MYKNKKEIFIVITMFSMLTILAVGYKFFKSNFNKNTEISKTYKNVKDSSENLEKKEIDSDKIFVHIDGEVNKPNLYEMKKSDRMKDLIDKAGGLTKNADASKINLAIKLKDEMKVHIYKIGEVKNNVNEGSKQNTSVENNNLININTATEQDLCKLTGIGPSKAKMIIEYREKTKFFNIEDITKVSGIGKKTFDKIKDKITTD